MKAYRFRWWLWRHFRIGSPSKLMYEAMRRNFIEITKAFGIPARAVGILERSCEYTPHSDARNAP
jgi:hypothetical protein